MERIGGDRICEIASTAASNMAVHPLVKTLARGRYAIGRSAKIGQGVGVGDRWPHPVPMRLRSKAAKHVLGRLCFPGSGRSPTWARKAPLGRNAMTGTGIRLGVRVVEMTHMVMGPTCGMILAQLGAEVIRSNRRWATRPAARGMGLVLSAVRSGQRSVGALSQSRRPRDHGPAARRR